MHIYERTYQTFMGVGMKVMPASKQILIKGPGSMSEIPGLLRAQRLARPLIVTGPRVSRTEFFLKLILLLKEAGIESAVFADVEPDPTTDLVRKVMETWQEERCDCFIALGGGSNMDAAKAAAAGIARPEKNLTQLGGVMKVRRETPYLIAVPTTAGTGSECTVAAVIKDSRTQRKFAINDPVLCPDAAVLDADLTAGVPASVVAATGMDALTHAVEAYLNRPYHKPAVGPLGTGFHRRGGSFGRNGFPGMSTSDKAGIATQGYGTASLCLQAVHDIMLYLPFVYEEALQKTGGKESTASETDSSSQGYVRARQKMLEASYLAGQAFTVACVGNVHAIAHTLGGLYHIPHGQANAVLLPVVLEDYGEKVYQPLSRLARAAGLDREISSVKAVKNDKGTKTGKNAIDDRTLAEAFITKIRQMNQEMNIPDHFDEIREEDLNKMAVWATREANPLYPVPVIYNMKDVKRILRKIRQEGS